MMERRVFITSAAALAIMAATPSVSLADQVADAETFVQDRGDSLIEILGMPAGDPRRKAFSDWLNGSFNLRLIGQLALGRYYGQATPEQLEAYDKAFNDYIVVTYEARFDTFTGYDFKVVRGRPAGQTDSVVQTLISGGNDRFNVDFRVRSADGSDLDVIDVTVERISMLQTQRDEFASVIQRSGMDGLIDGLKKRTADIEAQAAG